MMSGHSARHDVRSYQRYLLATLTSVLAFNYADRAALGVMMQDIKLDLALSDTELGILTGIAFAFFYAVLGIPIARRADRDNRVVIIVAGAAISGIAVALCGVAAGFMQLIVIRFFVGIGEAACVPPAHSLLADNFDRAARPRVMAVYKLGGTFSLLLGYVGGGYLNEILGWRGTFVVLGVPSLILAAIAAAILREPRLGAHQPRLARVLAPSSANPAHDQPSLAEAVRVLLRNSTFRHILLAACVASFFGAGIHTWEASFFMRSFGMTSGEVGMWLGASAVLGGFAGTYLGGALASRFAANDEARQLRAIGASFLLYGAVAVCKYTTSAPEIAFALTFVTAFCGGMILGPQFAIIQTIVPDRFRAMSVAVLFLFANLVGGGLGPLAVGVLSDLFHAHAGDESLRYAMLALCPGYLWSSWHYSKAARSVGDDLSRNLVSEA